jgi:hypothetical protein
MRVNIVEALIVPTLDVVNDGITDIMGSIVGKIEAKYCGKTT